MRIDLENKLAEDFPTQFRDLHGDQTKTAMAWGVSIGDGWFNLVYETCAAIEDELNRHPELRAKFYWTQIKEKFGGLCLYHTGGNQVIWNLSQAAEDHSWSVCEDCGSKEKVTSEGGWVRTLCPGCRGNPNRAGA